MTTDPCATYAKDTAALDHRVGDSLYNAIRETGRTCRVCAAPVAGYERCWRCHEHRRITAWPTSSRR